MIQVNYLSEVYVKIFGDVSHQDMFVGIKNIDGAMVHIIVPMKNIKESYLKIKIVGVDRDWFQWFDIEINDLRLRVPAIEIKKEIVKIISETEELR